MSESETGATLRNIETLLRAILAVQLDGRERELGTGSNRKIELVLNDMGLGAREIAALIGKNYDAVRKTLSRGKEPSRDV
jgi:hypothetical protein